MKYVPQWVKSDRKRFPRVHTHDGYEISNLSSFSQSNLAADKKAFCALIEVIKEYDFEEQTVLAVQVQNELGIVGRAPRDFAEIAQLEYESNVPTALIEDMKSDVESTEFITKVWNSCERSENNNWFNTFGRHGDEFLQAFSMAKYIEELAYSGKKIYSLPMYTNVWQDDQGFDIPGINYPSGGAVSKNIAMWKWVSKSLDMLCPDIYCQSQSKYMKVANQYTREDNALYVPETGCGQASAQWVFKAIAENGLTGIHFFGAENIIGEDGNIIQSAIPMKENFMALLAISPLLMQYQNSGKLYAVCQEEFSDSQEFEFDGYKGVASFAPFMRSGDFRHIGKTQSRGRGLIIQTNPNTFFICGTGFTLKLRKNPPLLVQLVAQQDYQEEHFMNYISVEEGHFDNDCIFHSARIRNGDQTDFGVFVYADNGAVKIVVD